MARDVSNMTVRIKTVLIHPYCSATALVQQLHGSRSAAAYPRLNSDLLHDLASNCEVADWLIESNSRPLLLIVQRLTHQPFRSMTLSSAKPASEANRYVPLLGLISDPQNPDATRRSRSSRKHSRKTRIYPVYLQDIHAKEDSQ